MASPKQTLAKKVRSLPVAVVASIVMLACTCDAEPASGAERGPCYGNGTCDADLVCASGRCVRLPDDGGEGEGEAGEGEGEGPPKGDAETFADAELAFYRRCYIPVAAGFLAEAEPAYNLEESLLDFHEVLIDFFSERAENPAFDFDRTQFDACLAELALPECPEGLFVESCDRFFVGNRQIGEGCRFFECADRGATFCAGGFGSECGICEPLPGDGDACPDPGCSAPNTFCAASGCVTGFVCDPNALSCTELPGDGELCVSSLCASELRCNLETNVCEPGAPTEPEPGDPCIDSCGDVFLAGSAGTISTNGLLCSSQSRTCEAVTVVPLGADCDEGGGPRYCVDQGFSAINGCIDDDFDGTSTCTALPGAGDPCLAGRCANFVELFCDVDTCVPLPLEGEPCDGFCGGAFVCDETNTCAAFEQLICPA